MGQRSKQSKHLLLQSVIFILIRSRLRQSQQIVKELLADENKRFVPLEKKNARALAAFLRANRPCKAAQPFQGIISLDNAPIRSIADTSTLSASNQSTPWSEFWDTELSLETSHREFIQTPQSEVDTEISTECVASGSDTLKAPASLVPETAAVRSQLFNQEALHDGLVVGKHLTTNDQLRANIMRFSNDSFSSSLLSDLVSVLRRRFSCSTFDTTDRLSISELSEPVTTPGTLKDRVESVLNSRHQADVKENTALIEQCCSRVSSCVHQAIRELASDGSEIPINAWVIFLKFYQGTDARINLSKGSDTLFFAARTGAHADVILFLLGKAMDPDSINNNGQTWLHCLDPQTWTNQLSGYDNTTFAAHCSVLYQLNYYCLAHTIDRIDDHGRHFLFYHCASSTFNLHMLQKLVERDSTWLKIVSSASQIRDRSGLFLWDYASTNPSFSGLSEEMLSLLRPKFDQESFESRILQGETPKGRTALHSHMEGFTAQSSYIANLYADTLFEHINRYDDIGHTPILTYVGHAFKSHEQESTICETVKLLVSWGANVNARSRMGATILHFAARNGAVQLLILLLDELGARVDICDDQGHSVADQVAKLMKASYNATRPAALLARSIRAAGKLLTLQTNQINQPITARTQPMKTKLFLQMNSVQELSLSVIIEVENRELKRIAVASFDIAYHSDIVSTRFLQNYPNLVYATLPEDTGETIYGREILQVIGTVDLRWYGRNSERSLLNNVLQFRARFENSSCKVVDSDEFELIIGQDTINRLGLLDRQKMRRKERT